MQMNALNYIRVVLVQPTHPGNIGATARAMANMGVSQLVLVDPKDFPSPVARARAVGADHLLDSAKVVCHLDEAISDCSMVVGSTARPRSIQWPIQSPEKAAISIATELRESKGRTPIAILFGRESSGLTNEEVERCSFLVQIPTEKSFASLNLASAVLLLLYELRKQLKPMTLNSAPIRDHPASAEEMRHFYLHLQRFVERVEFNDGRSAKLHRKMVRLFNRIRMHAQEVKMLRGMFRAVEDKIDGT